MSFEEDQSIRVRYAATLVDRCRRLGRRIERTRTISNLFGILAGLNLLVIFYNIFAGSPLWMRVAALIAAFVFMVVQIICGSVIRSTICNIKDLDTTMNEYERYLDSFTQETNPVQP